VIGGNIRADLEIRGDVKVTSERGERWGNVTAGQYTAGTEEIDREGAGVLD